MSYLFKGIYRYQTYAIELNTGNSINIQIPYLQSTGATINLDMVLESYYDGKGNKIFGVDLSPSEAKTAITYSDGSVEVLDNEETK